MTEPEFFDRLLDEWTRGADALAADRELLEEARAVYAPAELSEGSPEPEADGASASGRLAKFVRWVDGPDRFVTRPLWFLWVLAIHVALAALTLSLALFAAVVPALVLRLVLPAVPALLLTVPFAAAATAGTFVYVWRSFREQLGKFPW